MPCRLIISDIDGCISPEESVPWDFDPFLEFCRMVHPAATGQGELPPMTLCTGRPQPYVEALCKILDIRLPVICESGAVFYTLKDNRACYGPGVTADKVTGLRAIRCFVEEHILPCHPGTLLQFGKEAQISVYCPDPQVLPGIGKLVANFASQRGGPELIINASHYYLNISLGGVDKGSAIAHILQEFGIDRAHAAGIGDTVGDLPIRDHVAFFACPSNSVPAIKEVADYVSPYPMMRGMLDILKRPELRREQDIP